MTDRLVRPINMIETDTFGLYNTRSVDLVAGYIAIDGKFQVGRCSGDPKVIRLPPVMVDDLATARALCQDWIASRPQERLPYANE